MGAEYGSTGLKRFAGRTWIVEEWQRELSGKLALDVYREMADSDSTIAAMLFAIKMLARSVDWYVAETSDDSDDIDAADFLQRNMDELDMPWHEVITEALSMVQYGHSVHEIVYRRCEDTGRIMWKKLPIRAQNTILYWEFDEENNGAIKGIWQLSPPFYRLTYIPFEKLLLFRTESNKANPEGRSILRTAYRAYKYKQRLSEIEAIGIERAVAGIPRIWLPPNITNPGDDPDAATALTAFENMGKAIRQDAQATIIMPLVYDENNNKVYDMDLLTTESTQNKVGEVIARYSNEILQSCLAEFINLGSQAVGSYALSDNKTKIFMKALGAFLDSIEEVFNTFAVPRLFELNPSFSLEKLPKIRHKPVNDVDLMTIAELLKVLVPAGMALFPDIKTENFLREAMGLPSKAEELFDAEVAQQEAAQAEQQAQLQTLNPGVGIDLDKIPEKVEIEEGEEEA